MAQLTWQTLGIVLSSHASLLALLFIYSVYTHSGFCQGMWHPGPLMLPE